MPFYFFARKFIGIAREFIKVPIKLFFSAREFPGSFKELFYSAPAFLKLNQSLLEHFREFILYARRLTNASRKLGNVAKGLSATSIRLTNLKIEFGGGICQPYGGILKFTIVVKELGRGSCLLFVNSGELLAGNNIFPLNNSVLIDHNYKFLRINFLFSHTHQELLKIMRQSSGDKNPGLSNQLVQLCIL